MGNAALGHSMMKVAWTLAGVETRGSVGASLLPLHTRRVCMILGDDSFPSEWQRQAWLFHLKDYPLPFSHHIFPTLIFLSLENLQLACG